MILNLKKQINKWPSKTSKGKDLIGNPKWSTSNKSNTLKLDFLNFIIPVPLHYPQKEEINLTKAQFSLAMLTAENQGADEQNCMQMS